ncbi:MAG: outer membrane lipoprotein-sorting protein [Spirochaetales bacterium]|nr:outer membrane lipoprotein-sorting protein [Spirochaetales bacterium]
MKLLKNAALAASLVLLNAGLFAITGTEIAENSRNIPDPVSSHGAVKMDLINASGDVDSRMVEEWTTEEGDLASTIMVFRSPASVANTRFLQKENDGRDDDKWIYLPALKRVRRIASSDGDKSFMGTDMTYDDMETREVEQDNHELLGEETVGSWNCYKVKVTAKDPADSQYSYKIAWYDKESWYPVKVEMYDKNQALLKVMSVEDLKTVDGYLTPMSVYMENVQENHATRVTMMKIVYDEPVNDRLFTTTFLEQGR